MFGNIVLGMCAGARELSKTTLKGKKTDEIYQINIFSRTRRRGAHQYINKIKRVKSPQNVTE